MTEALKTLFHPFESGTLDLPETGKRVLFLGAVSGLRLPVGFNASITAVQGFRPEYLALEKQGISVSSNVEGESFDLALILGSKHRGQNEDWIAEAQRRVKPGGLIVVAATKKDGGDSLRKRMAEMPGYEDHASKYHGVVFWIRAGEGYLPLAVPEPVGRFATRPGMFSHGRADPGSEFLLQCLPNDLKGDVADFCAGWGFLTASLIERETIKRVDLYEADHAALEAANRGLKDVALPLGFHWHDLASEKVIARYDAIVMNPPFHAGGKATEPELGARMIRAAATALKGHGRLFVVANRALPYEKAMTGVFAATGEVARNESFKVLYGAGPRTR